jgi:molybdenum cofactor biosynthesis protein B
VLSLALLTISDTRTPETDTNGAYLKAQIAAAGHRVVHYEILPDEPEQVVAMLQKLAQTDAQVVLLNGGTGISPRDNTYDAVSSLLEKTLPGFGEIFRMLSYEQVGAAAMLSRAVAGIYAGRVIFSTPGSHKAVQLAWEKLILPELTHLVWELQK